MHGLHVELDVAQTTLQERLTICKRLVYIDLWQSRKLVHDEWIDFVSALLYQQQYHRRWVGQECKFDDSFHAVMSSRGAAKKRTLCCVFLTDEQFQGWQNTRNPIKTAVLKCREQQLKIGMQNTLNNLLSRSKFHFDRFAFKNVELAQKIWSTLRISRTLFLF